MNAAEIANRVLQRARQWAGPSPDHALRGVRLGAPAAACPALPEPAAAPPAVRAASQARAATLRAGRWTLFGWRTVQVSHPPRWHEDHLARAGPPLIGPEPRGVWEINRWAEAVGLAQHAWLDVAPDDARLAQAWLDDWCTHNPVGEGLNWDSALEAAVRLVNFCWIDALLRACGLPDIVQTQDRLAHQIVPAHVWWIWRHRSPGSSANNHLIGELAALVLAARRWPEVARLGCSATRAWHLLAREVLRQFAPDGGNREQALHYHHFAWELTWHALRVVDAEDEARAPVAERLRAAAQHFCDLTHMGDPWDFGDSDDAQLVPLFLSRATAACEWRAWLLGQAGEGALAFWLGAPPAGVVPLPPGVWRAYPDSGLGVQEVNGWKARVDASPLGYGPMASHGHLDALHLSLWDGPVALVVDPGTGAYHGHPDLRARLASWDAHNGPIPLAGRESPRRRGAFVWSDHHETPGLRLDGPVCEVRWRPPPGPGVTRTIRYVPEGDAWRVIDEVAGPEPHVVRWRLAPEWTVSPRDGRGLALVHRAGRVVRLAFGSGDIIGYAVGEDVTSPHFGQVRPGVVIEVIFRRRLVSHWSRVTAHSPERL